jgi:hypothetical protein
MLHNRRTLTSPEPSEEPEVRPTPSPPPPRPPAETWPQQRAAAAPRHAARLGRPAGRRLPHRRWPRGAAPRRLLSASPSHTPHFRIHAIEHIIINRTMTRRPRLSSRAWACPQPSAAARCVTQPCARRAQRPVTFLSPRGRGGYLHCSRAGASRGGKCGGRRCCAAAVGLVRWGSDASSNRVRLRLLRDAL